METRLYNENRVDSAVLKFPFKRRNPQSTALNLTRVVDKLISHYKACEKLSENIIEIKDNVITKHVKMSTDDWNLRFSKLEQMMRKTTQWCLMTVTKFRSSILNYDLLSNSGVSNNDIDHIADKKCIKEREDDGERFEIVSPLHPRNLYKMNSPKKRFVVEGIRHSGVATASAAFLKENKMFLATILENKELQDNCVGEGTALNCVYCLNISGASGRFCGPRAQR